MPNKKQTPNKKEDFLEGFRDSISTKAQLEEFVETFKVVIGIFNQLKTENESERAEMNKWMANTSNVIQKRLKELKNGPPGRTPMKGIDYFDGKPGEPGESANEERITRTVLERIQLPEQKEIILDGPDEIRNKLELLQGEERIHISAIHGLDDYEEIIKRRENVAFINGKGPLWGLEDVNVIGITIGQSIQWNGIQWVPYTPGSGNSGYQQPTSGSVNGTNTIFVFATAPSAISVDNGRIIQKVSSDGTVNWTGTTTITLTIAPNNDIFAVA